MSHEIVKGISIRKDKVFLTSADSSIRPLYFTNWECIPLTKILAEQGKEALFAKIGEEVWNGNMKLWQGSKLCQMFLEAKNAFPSHLNFMNYDGKTAGEFMGKMVAELEKDSEADLSSFKPQILAVRNDRDYILETAKRTGHNFLNFAGLDLQKDREFAMEVVLAGAGAAWFNYPLAFTNDKEFALESLKLNGCFYRQLDDDLKGDPEIIYEAFKEREGRTFHEHLPDLIPAMTFFEFESNPIRPTLDKKFAIDLLECSPHLHMDRVPWLLQDRDIALKWCQVGKFFPHSFSELPKQFKQDPEFQDVLIKRFEGTDKYDALMSRFAVEGLIHSDNSLDAKIKAAQARSGVAQAAAKENIKGHEPDR